MKTWTFRNARAFVLCALILLTVFLSTSGAAAATPGKNAPEYKTILKRPVVNSLQDVMDRTNVRELLEFERFSRDNGHWDAMDECYAPDSRVDISWFQGTGHEFVEATKKLNSFAPHKIYTTGVWTRGDRAVAIMLITLHMRQDIDGYPVDLLTDSQLVFRTQRINGRWYIVAFDVIYEKDSLVPVFPNSNINIPAEEVSKYRASYGGMIYLRKKAGLPIAEDLPGIDRPDLVEKLYRTVDDWLSE